MYSTVSYLISILPEICMRPQKCTHGSFEAQFSFNVENESAINKEYPQKLWIFHSNIKELKHLQKGTLCLYKLIPFGGMYLYFL